MTQMTQMDVFPKTISTRSRTESLGYFARFGHLGHKYREEGTQWHP